MKFLLDVLRTIFEALFKNVIHEVKKPTKGKDAPASPDREQFLNRMREFEGSLRGLPDPSDQSRPKRKR